MVCSQLPEHMISIQQNMKRLNQRVGIQPRDR